MKNFLLYVLAGIAGWLFFTYVFNYAEQTYYNNSENVEQPTETIDRELQNVLYRIAGTYEFVEHLGIYGFKTIYTVTVNRDGTGKVVYEDGSVENFYGAYLTDESTIVFKGNYGGTVFKLVGRGIEDEACRKYVSEIGTPKYYMNKIR